MAQSDDFNVANSSGANVRSDLNTVLGAIRTNSSGTTAPPLSGYQWFMNSGDNRLFMARGSAPGGGSPSGEADAIRVGDFRQARIPASSIDTEGTNPVLLGYRLFNTSDIIVTNAAGTTRRTVSNMSVDSDDTTVTVANLADGDLFYENYFIPANDSGNEVHIPDDVLRGVVESSGTITFTREDGQTTAINLGTSFANWATTILETITYTSRSDTAARSLTIGSKVGGSDTDTVISNPFFDFTFEGNYENLSRTEDYVVLTAADTENSITHRLRTKVYRDAVLYSDSDTIRMSPEVSGSTDSERSATIREAIDAGRNDIRFSGTTTRTFTVDVRPRTGSIDPSDPSTFPDDIPEGGFIAFY